MAVAVRKPLTRSERIEYLLETLDEAREGQGTAEAPADSRDSRVLLLPELYHQGSYAELERCLQAMRTSETSFEGHAIARLVFHVTGWYCAPRRVTQRCRNRRCKGKCGDRNPEHTVAVIEQVRARSVERRLAQAGVSFLSTIFRGEPFVPGGLG